jgi:chemotaxis protein CheD
MRTEFIGNQQRVIINPGELFASNTPVTISTLLGSCVSACLFDPVNKVMGMNHFMLSQQRLVSDSQLARTEAGRYGINSMELLINEMLKLGAKKQYIQAKAFGGSTLIGNGSSDNIFLNVGAVNSKFIHEFLTHEAIPLVAENLGGKEGRMIHFSFGDFAVYMRKIRSADKSKRIAIRDRECWEHAIIEQQKHERAAKNIELWI